MNKSEYQDLKNLGPIPEGKYYFDGKDWNALSPAKQAYFMLTNQGDWGDFNVKLNPIDYTGNRNNFYIHGGSYPGSAGCIDALSNVKHIYNLTKNQNYVELEVKY